MFGNDTYFDILPKSVEEAYNEDLAEGEWKSKKEAKEEIALNLLKEGFCKDDVCIFTALSLDKINLLSSLI